MRSRVAALVLTASLGLAAPASASTQFTYVNGGTVTAYGYYVGQYNGLMGTKPVLLNCVDFFHEVREGQVWQANLTDLSGDVGFGTVTRYNNVMAYRMAAFLVTQYAGKTDAQVGEIQATIWGMFGVPGSPDPGTDFWRNQASSFVSANPAGSNYAGFYIVSDVNTRLPNGDDNPLSVQEFVIFDPDINVEPIPEPATMLLVATGLAGLAGLRLRRRKNG